MMKSVLVVALVTALGSSTFAAENGKELDNKLASLNVKNNQFAQDLAALRKQQEEAGAKASALRKEFKMAEQQWEKSAGGIIGGFGRGSGDPALKTKMDEARAKLEVAQKAAGELEMKAQTLGREASGLALAARRDEIDQKRQVAALNSAILGQSILTEFAMVQNKLGDTDMVLEKMSNAYDKSMLGAYLKDKIGLLVNSQLMCESVARCNVKERKEVPAERIQETLFPGTANSTRKGNLYDKTHETKSAK